MTLLIFEPAKPKRSGTKKPLKFILGIGALVGTIALGSTFAASINLNNSGPVEFGQGVTQTVACSGDDSITVTPTSQFINSDGAGGYYFTSVSLSDIPSNCLGVDFEVTAYDQAGESIVLTTNNCYLPGAGDKPVARFEGFASATTDQSYDEMYSFVTQSDSSSFTLTWVDNNVNGCRSAALAEDVYRITIESSDTVYEVGGTGPGGGTIFYFSETSFSCGPTLSSTCNYLEAALGDWYGEDDPQISWSTGENQELTVTGADEESIGSGYKNSLDIANQSGNVLATTAALAARGHDGGGKSDWYLPSKAELDILFIQKDLIGDFTASNYWSSTEVFNNGAWNQNFTTREQGENGKFDLRSVRPIRAF
jgi:hypothetical protein